MKLSAIEQAMEPFRAAAGSPEAAARAEGVPTAGYFCNYVPVELLIAAGYQPLRLQGTDTSEADAYIQPWVCSVARAAFSAAAQSEGDGPAVVVFSHTCDTMQNLAEVWRDAFPSTNVVTVTAPVLLSGPEAFEYFRAELERVRGVLGEASGHAITDSALDEAIGVCTEQRAAMQGLFALHRQHPGILPAAELHAVVQSALAMAPARHAAAVRELTGTLAREPEGGGGSKPVVFVTGSACWNGDYLAALEESGCCVGGDDLCTGARMFDVPEPGEGTPLERLTRMYLDRAPCPSKSVSTAAACRRLTKRAKACGAEGIVFLLTKFCDPWAFDRVLLGKAAAEAGLPALTVEIEQHTPPPAQMRTRFEAFAEQLEANRHA